MLRSIQDNKDIASAEVVGRISDTHRFRTIPDFQYATSTSTLMQNLRSSIFTTDLPSIRDFTYDKSKQLPLDQDVGPPPFFTIVRQPFNYSYKQNPYIKVYRDADGNIKVTNTTAPIKHIRHNIDPDAPSIPTGPPAELAPLESTAPKVQEAVKKLRKMFDTRPLMQRRVFVNTYPGKQSENELKAAVGYCGYAFTSGPWRDTVVKFGVDPRKDSRYRIYQTVSYQLQDERKGAADDPGNYIRRVGGKRVTAKKAKVEHSHVFDGTKFYKDGKVWQACDVTDSMLKELLENAPLRDEPDVRAHVASFPTPRIEVLTWLDDLLRLVRQRHLVPLPAHHEIQTPMPRQLAHPRRRTLPRRLCHVPHIRRRVQRAPDAHRRAGLVPLPIAL
jgi:general transcription factor 3C polypeptide 5 (transcription factor C subunit 1)